MADAENKTETVAAPQPGTVISPNAGQPQNPEPKKPVEAVQQPVPTTQTSSYTAGQAEPASTEIEAVQKAEEPADPEAAQSSDVTATIENTTEPNATQIAEDGQVSWQASEFIAHTKTPGWYLALAAGTLLLALLVFFLTRDNVSAGVVLVAGLILAIYANVKPRQLDYSLGAQGLQIGQKYYAYEDFRSFAIVPEGAFSSIVLMPLKRFSTLTTIYYPPEEEEKIVSVLSNYLPLDEHKHDAVDRFMRRIRF